MPNHPEQREQQTIHTVPLSTLVERCHHAQTAPNMTHEAGDEDHACLEILRRALDEDDTLAWQAFEAQFLPLFTHWIQQDLTHFGLQNDSATHQAMQPAIIDSEEIWADARSRFIIRYARLQQLTDTFEHIGAVLKVLQKCIRSSVQEVRRQHDRHVRLTTAIIQFEFIRTQEHQLPTTQVELAELRRCIRNQIEQDVPEPELRQLLFWRYVDDLKPREISANHPEQYPTTDAVHTALERVMKRLRRRIDQYVQRCL